MKGKNKCILDVGVTEKKEKYSDRFSDWKSRDNERKTEKQIEIKNE